jgi:hypothetical protein
VALPPRTPPLASLEAKAKEGIIGIKKEVSKRYEVLKKEFLPALSSYCRP